MRVEFEADSHTYKIDGKPVSSVTQVLKQAGSIDGRFYHKKAAHRGTVAHEAIVLADQGIVGPEFYTSEIAGYVMAFMKFRRENDWESVGYEQIVFDPENEYAGTQDLLGVLNGRRTIVDIKTGKPADWHGVQLAAYRLAPYRQQQDGTVVEQDANVQVRNLYVAADGRYQLADRHNGCRYDMKVWDQRWRSALKVRAYGPNKV